MVYDTPESVVEIKKYEYPPVPDPYIDRYTTSASTSSSDQCPPALNYRPEFKPSSHPYYSYQKPASSSSTASSHLSSYPDEELTLNPPAPFSQYETPTSPALSGCAPSPTPTYASDDHFVSSFPPPIKRTRGTTGHIVCDRCGGRFTVLSSLNRHSRICRGTKSARRHFKRSASSQCDTAETRNASLEPENSGKAPPTDEALLGSSEERKLISESNANPHATATAGSMADPSSTVNARLVSDPSEPIELPVKQGTEDNQSPTYS